MTKPLALIFYEKLLPGSQLINRFQDLGYRVNTITDLEGLLTQALKEKPLLIVLDLMAKSADPSAAISQIRQHPDTTHIPVLAYGADKEKKLQETARVAGATLIAGEVGVLEQLPQLLEQVLQVE